MGRLDRQRALRLRFRRTLRLQRRQVGELSAVAEQRLEDDFFKRLERLGTVRRFVTVWVLLLVLLIGCTVVQARGLSSYYQTLQPAPGGTYTEGVLGTFTNANPIYATSLADSSVSHLIFSGLLTYSQQNQLTGDLADTWSVDARGTTYTLHTSADVLFTYQVIQNPDARSPLFSSFQGITVGAPDLQTVTFTLPNTLASFPYSLTNGIVPKHLLGGTAMADMRSVAFNTTAPVGSGPFQWQAIELTGNTADNRQEHIALKAFSGYHFGRPKLSNFVVRTFRSASQMTGSFKKQEVNGIAGLDELPKALKGAGGVRVYSLPLSAAVMAFFDTGNGVTNDVNVRKALVASADVDAIISKLSYATQPVREPLLHGQLAYNANYQQPAYDPGTAIGLLQNSGWTMGKNGIRTKGGQPLTVALYYHSGGEYDMVAHLLAEYWRKVGIDTQLNGKGDSDFQSVISQAPSPVLKNYVYNVLLYGISVGVDPDVYVYWDSSQIDPRSKPRLNFSEWSNKAADTSLEAGRTRLDPQLRTIKYQPFLQNWQADAPALGLYQPRFLYITHGTVYGLSETTINSDTQRFSNVYNWEVREVRQ
jgi:peptide/nickel transport system substrate-binding protein